MGNDLFDSIVSKVAVSVPLFAKAIVEIGLEIPGANPWDATPSQLKKALDEYVLPKIRSFASGYLQTELMGGGIIRTDREDRVIGISSGITQYIELEKKLDPGDPVLYGKLYAAALIMKAAELVGVAEGHLSRRINITRPYKSILDVTISLLTDVHGEPAGTISVIRDITLSEKLIEEITILYESLEEKVKERTLELEKSRNKLSISNDKLQSANDELQRITDELIATNEELKQTSAELEEEKLGLEEKVKERTRNLIASQERLLRAEKMAALGQLTGGIAQEFNNPLGIILGFAQTGVKQIKAGDSFYLPLKSIEREAFRCRKMIDAMFAFSRGGQSFVESADLNILLQNTLNLIKAEAKIKSVAVLEEYAAGLPKIEINKNQIQQVIVNLCSNALDAMPNGGILKIVTQMITDEKTQMITEKEQTNTDKPIAIGDNKSAIIRIPSSVIISVSDTGTGLSEEARKHLFEPFFTTKPAGQGIGLGLSLCYEIIRQHNGTIEAESGSGQGAAFIIRIPIR